MFFALKLYCLVKVEKMNGGNSAVFCLTRDLAVLIDVLTLFEVTAFSTSLHCEALLTVASLMH